MVINTLNCISKVVEATASLSAEVSKITPKTTHIIGGKKLNEGQARKHLLGIVGRDTLSKKIVELYNNTRELSRLHCHWCMQPSLETHAEFGEVVSAAQSTFGEAKSVLTTIAALSVILESDKADQKTEAKMKRKRIKEKKGEEEKKAKAMVV